MQWTYAPLLVACNKHKFKNTLAKLPMLFLVDSGPRATMACESLMQAWT